jgi:hypothetical protein
MDLIRDTVEELLFRLGRPAAHPRNLDDDQAVGVVQSKIAVFRINDLIGCVTVNDLKMIIGRYVGDGNHGSVDRRAHYTYELGGGFCADVYSG